MSSDSILLPSSSRDPFSLGRAALQSRSHEERPAIDLPSLLRRCMEEATFCGMILHKFASRSDDQLAALERALAAGNLQDVSREAHTLQGVAANLSAGALRLQAERLEEASLAGDLSAARRAFSAIRSEVERCNALIPTLLDHLAA